MFKTKIRILNKEWNEIDSYKSRFNPKKDEYIFLKKMDKYYKILEVIHSISDNYELILVVEPLENKIS